MTAVLSLQTCVACIIWDAMPNAFPSRIITLAMPCCDCYSSETLQLSEVINVTCSPLLLPMQVRRRRSWHDDGIRPDISTAALSKLKAVFKKDGTTTAGNSSQVCLHLLFDAPFDSTACSADSAHPPVCLSQLFESQPRTVRVLLLPISCCLSLKQVHLKLVHAS